MTESELVAKALHRSAVIRRVLATPEGVVLLEVLQEFAEDLREKVERPGMPFDAGAALVATGAQQQIDNLKFYAKERKTDG